LAVEVLPALEVLAVVEQEENRTGNNPAAAKRGSDINFIFCNLVLQLQKTCQSAWLVLIDW
jgi:hypothetical protein